MPYRSHAPLVDAGLPVLEVTLRTPVALDAIRRMREIPGAIVGAGTVLNAHDLAAVEAAGAAFAISPGATDALYAAAKSSAIPFLPGIATASELMRGLEHGWTPLQVLSRRGQRRHRSTERLRGTVPAGEVLPHRRHRRHEGTGLSRAVECAHRRRILDGAERCAEGEGLGEDQDAGSRSRALRIALAGCCISCRSTVATCVAPTEKQGFCRSDASRDGQHRRSSREHHRKGPWRRGTAQGPSTRLMPERDQNR